MQTNNKTRYRVDMLPSALWTIGAQVFKESALLPTRLKHSSGVNRNRARSLGQRGHRNGKRYRLSKVKWDLPISLIRRRFDTQMLKIYEMKSEALPPCPTVPLERARLPSLQANSLLSGLSVGLSIRVVIEWLASLRRKRTGSGSVETRTSLLLSWVPLKAYKFANDGFEWLNDFPSLWS